MAGFSEKNIRDLEGNACLSTNDEESKVIRARLGSVLSFLDLIPEEILAESPSALTFSIGEHAPPCYWLPSDE